MEWLMEEVEKRWEGKVDGLWEVEEVKRECLVWLERFDE